MIFAELRLAMLIFSAFECTHLSLHFDGLFTLTNSAGKQREVQIAQRLQCVKIWRHMSWLNVNIAAKNGRGVKEC